METKTNTNNPKMTNEGFDCDRISDLPDSVLIEILALLTAKEVAQTCILSKRWCKLWASVPCLDFNFSEFQTGNFRSDIERFTNFVPNFLQFREDGMDIERFKLNCDVDIRDCRTETGIYVLAIESILYALEHKPKKLDIMLKTSLDYLHVPLCIFTCESLEEAYLSVNDKGSSLEIRPDIVFLPNLRTLHFSNAKIKKDCMETILSGCPALESLSLYYCAPEKVCNVSHRTLKRLTVISCQFGYDSPAWSFSAPNLEYLNIAGYFPSKLKGVSMVTKAIISTKHDGVYNRQLLSDLAGVKDMQLYNPYLEEMLAGELPNCPTFYNLKILTLGGCCMYCNFDPVPSLLKLCPNLEHLIFLHDEVHYCKEDKYYLEQKERFDCTKLRLVDVRYKNWNHEVNQLRRLLLHSLMNIEGVQIIFTEEERAASIFIGTE